MDILVYLRWPFGFGYIQLFGKNDRPFRGKRDCWLQFWLYRRDFGNKRKTDTPLVYVIITYAWILFFPRQTIFSPDFLDISIYAEWWNIPLSRCLTWSLYIYVCIYTHYYIHTYVYLNKPKTRIIYTSLAIPLLPFTALPLLIISICSRLFFYIFTWIVNKRKGGAVATSISDFLSSLMLFFPFIFFFVEKKLSVNFK